MSTALEDLLTTGQAARRLDRSRERVSQLIRAGKLPAVNTAIGRLVDPVEVDRLLRERERRTAQDRVAVS